MAGTVPLQAQYSPPQVVVIQQPQVPRRYDSYNTSLSQGLGITRIITGTLAILFQTAAIVLVASDFQVTGEDNYIGAGIWGGAFVSTSALLLFVYMGLLSQFVLTQYDGVRGQCEALS